MNASFYLESGIDFEGFHLQILVHIWLCRAVLTGLEWVQVGLFNEERAFK